VSRFNSRGPVTCFLMAVRESTEHTRDSWTALHSASPFMLSHVLQPCEDNLSEKDPYVLSVSLYGDALGVHERGGGSQEGYYGGYKSLCLEDRAYFVRPLFYIPPGALPDALLNQVDDDLILAVKEVLAVYGAFNKDNVVLLECLCLVVLDLPSAARFSTSIEAPGSEHCTSCDMLQKEALTERTYREMTSTVFYCVRASQY